MSIIDYINPWSPEFHESFNDFSKLNPGYQALTIVTVALASLALLGIGGVAVFRMMVNAFKPLDRNDKSKQGETAGKIDTAAQKALEAAIKKRIIHLMRR